MTDAAAAPAQGQPAAAPDSLSQPTGQAAAPTHWGGEFAEYAQAKGWGDPVEAVRSYRNLEQLFTSDKLGYTVAIPKEGDSDAWGKFYNRLGRPEDAKGYELPIPDGAPTEFADWAKGVFHEAGLSASQAKAVAGKWNEYMGAQQAQTTEQMRYQGQQEAEGIKREWGAAYDQNLMIARSATQKYGFDEGTLGKLESAMGYAGLMKFMHKLGASTSEAPYVDGGSNQSNGIMTPSQAMEKLSGLGKDKEFMDAFLNPKHPKHQWAKDHKSRLSSWAFPS